MLVAALLVGAASGGYAIGHARAAAQPPPGTVSASFVTFRLASGWKVSARTPSLISLKDGAGGSVSVQVGDAGQAGVTSDADVFQNELHGHVRQYPGLVAGSCLPVTRVTVGGKTGEQIGLLYRPRAATRPESCELIWADVHGSKFYAWYSLGGAAGLSKRVRALQEMQRTAVWRS